MYKSYTKCKNGYVHRCIKLLVDVIEIALDWMQTGIKKVKMAMLMMCFMGV